MYYILQLYAETCYFLLYILTMAISIAKTCSCWYSLQYMLCWQIICSFYWLKTKGGQTAFR